MCALFLLPRSYYHRRARDRIVTMLPGSGMAKLGQEIFTCGFHPCDCALKFGILPHKESIFKPQIINNS
jgi:hypothetical protein